MNDVGRKDGGCIPSHETSGIARQQNRVRVLELDQVFDYITQNRTREKVR